VAAFDPMTMTQLVENELLGPVAEEIRARLERVIEAM